MILTRRQWSNVALTQVGHAVSVISQTHPSILLESALVNELGEPLAVEQAIDLVIQELSELKIKLQNYRAATTFVEVL